MDIRVLRYYLAVCHEGTMSRAAQALHVTQPTLSRQIADLERELGCTLLIRGARSITLTEKGIYLRKRAEEIVALADRTQESLMRDDAVVEGDVYIGAGESEGMRSFAEAVRSFRERYPHVCFRLRSGNSIDVLEWLERGLVDFAVLISYPDIGRFEHLRLAATDVWGVLMPSDSPLAAHREIGPSDLAGLPLILSEQALETGELAAWLGGSARTAHNDTEKPPTAATYNLAFNAAQLVKEGVGYALTLEGLVATGNGTGLVFRPLNPPLLSSIDFAWKHDHALSTAARLFLEEMRTQAAQS